MLVKHFRWGVVILVPGSDLPPARWHSFRRDEGGSTLLERSLGVALILGIVLPFASLVSYATYAARDLAAVQSSARTAARTEAATTSDVGVTFSCGSSPSAAIDPCPATLARGSYVAASKD